MDLRKISFRIMLLAIILTAVAGAVAILGGGMNNWEVFVGMGVLTAICTGLMMPVSRMIADPKTRSSGMVALVTIILSFLVGSSALWINILIRGFSSLSENLWLTLAVTALGGLALTISVRIRESGGGIVASGVMLFFASTSILAYLALIWLDSLITRSSTDGWELIGHFQGTLAAYWLYGAGIVMCLVGFTRGDSRPWRWIGILAALAGFALAWYGIWNYRGTDEFLATLLTALSSLCAFIAFTNLILLVKLREEQRWVSYLTIVSGLATCCLVVAAVYVGTSGYGSFDDGIGRLLGASGIATTCAILAVAVLAAMNKRSLADAVEGVKYTIALECPRCFTHQVVNPGDVECSACSLRISVKIEEPLCPNCSYPIYKTRARICPECGWTSSPRSAPPVTPAPAGT